MARYATPLRYPGGKQKLSPFMSKLIEQNDLAGCAYAEPYAGGAGIAVDLLLSKTASHIHLNDASYHIFAFWAAVTTEPERFCAAISAASLTVNDWLTHREVVRQPEKHSLFEVGYSTFYLNRTNRSGVLTGGVIGGLQQQGRWRIDARFPRNELIRRIELIADRADLVSVTNMDAVEFMTTHADSTFKPNTLLYCDPPYYQRSRRLYLSWYEQKDHREVSQVIQRLRFPWVVSYDGHPDIFDMYKSRWCFSYALQYSATRAYKGSEVLVFSDDLLVPLGSGVRAIDTALAALPPRSRARLSG